MKAPTTKERFADAQKVLDYGFSNYSYKELGKKDDLIRNLPVTKGVESNIDIVLESDMGALIQKGKEKKLFKILH